MLMLFKTFQFDCLINVVVYKITLLMPRIKEMCEIDLPVVYHSIIV